MTADLVLMVGGWLLAALAGLLSVKFNPDRPIVPFRHSDPRNLDWRVSGPYFLGLCVSVIGGAGLQQQQYIGFWAIPLTIIPLTLAYVLPVQRHNRQIRRSRLG